MDVFIYVALALVFLYFLLRREPRKGKPLPGPRGWPLVGYAFNLKRETVHDTYFELAEKYGDIFQINALGMPIVVINNAEMIRSIFCDEQYRKFTNDRISSFFPNYVLYGNKSIFSTMNAHNSPHGDMRKAFTKGMHVYGEGIKAFEDKVHFELVKLSERLEGYDGKEFDMTEFIIRSLSSIVSIFLSGEPIADDDPDANMFWEFDRCIDHLISPDLDLVLCTFPFLRFVPGKYKKLFDDTMRAREKIIKRQFHEAKRKFKEGTAQGLIGFYLSEQKLAEQEGRPVLFTDDRICALLLETVVGGVLTTLSTLTSHFLCLVNHPEYQVRIQEEIDRVMSKDLPSLPHRHNCPFIEAVNLEVHRLITVLPLSFPHLCKPNIEFKGYDIPANTLIVANSWFIHHDEKIWGDPWTFRPERWLDEQGELLPNDHVLRRSWLPFGIGRRQCIGESLARSRTFLYVATMLQRWSFQLAPGQTMSCDPRREDMDVDVTCRPTPYMCRAVPRN